MKDLGVIQIVYYQEWGEKLNLSKQDILIYEGRVIDLLPNAMFRVKLEQNGHIVTAHTAGRLRCCPPIHRSWGSIKIERQEYVYFKEIKCGSRWPHMIFLKQELYFDSKLIRDLGIAGAYVWLKIKKTMFDSWRSHHATNVIILYKTRFIFILHQIN